MSGRFGRRRATPRSDEPVIPGFLDLTLIGSGGFSKVYTAYQERFARTVAVKVITVDLSPDASRRFEREQQTAGQLDGHPNVIRVYESGFTEGGRPYLVMEHHAEGSLADRVRRHGPIPVADALDIGVKLAGALGAAHAKGVVHRDVKPQNVLVSPFVGPVLADFGIAALDPTRFTVTTEAFSVNHAAPEVLSGEPATFSSDLYSLASLLYELLSGRPPFADPEQPDLLALIRRVQRDPVPPIGRPDLPAPAEAALLALLARDPADRPADAAAFASRLGDVQRLLGLTAAAEITGDPGGSSSRWAPGGSGADTDAARWRPPTSSTDSTTGSRPSAPTPPPVPGPGPGPDAEATLAPSGSPWAPSPPAPDDAVDPAPLDRVEAAPVDDLAAADPVDDDPSAPFGATIVPPRRSSPTPSPIRAEAPLDGRTIGPPAGAVGPPGPGGGAGPAAGGPREVDGTAMGSVAALATPAPAVTRPAKRWWVIGAVAVLIVALGGGFLALRPDGKAPPTPATGTEADTDDDAAAVGSCPAGLAERYAEESATLPEYDTDRPPTDVAAVPKPTDPRIAIVSWTDTNAGRGLYVVLIRCTGGADPVVPAAVVALGAKPSVEIGGLEDRDYCFSVIAFPTQGRDGEPAVGTTADGRKEACLGDD